MKKNILLIWFILTGTILTAQGIQDSLFRIQQVRVTATREFKKEEAGMTTIMLDTFQLANSFNLDLGTLLSENSHLIIKDYGRGSLSTASFRGTAPSHTQVTWNGMNINSPMLGMVDLSIVPVWMADQVSILHGSASLFSQSGGLGGLIQLESSPSWETKNSGRLFIGGGSFHSGDFYGQYNTGTSKLKTTVRIYFNGSENDYPFVNKFKLETDSITGEVYYPEERNQDADYRKYGMSYEWNYRPSSKSVISNSTWVQDAKRSLPSVLSNEFAGESQFRKNQQSDVTLRNSLRYSYFGDKSTLRILSGLDFQNMSYTAEQEVSGLDMQQLSRSYSRSSGMQNRISYETRPSEKVTIQFQGSANIIKASTIDSVTYTGYEKKRIESSVHTAGYYSPFAPLQFSFQLRKDFVKTFDTPLIYSAGISYKPFRHQSLYVKGNVAKNHHIPSLNDLYWQPYGNPDLLPEEGITSEFGIDYKRETSNINLSTSITAYYSNINNWIIWLPGDLGGWEPFNIDAVRAKGLEVHVNTGANLFNTWFRFFGNISYTRTSRMDLPYAQNENKLRNQLPFIPLFSGNFLFSVKNHGFYATIQNNSMSMRNILTSSSADLLESDVNIDELQSHLLLMYPHYLNKLTLGKEIRTHAATLDLRITVDNLFNETYRNILNRFMPGRSYMLTISYKW